MGCLLATAMGPVILILFERSKKAEVMFPRQGQYLGFLFYQNLQLYKHMFLVIA